MNNKIPKGVLHYLKILREGRLTEKRDRRTQEVFFIDVLGIVIDCLGTVVSDLNFQSRQRKLCRPSPNERYPDSVDSKGITSRVSTDEKDETLILLV